MAINLLDEEQIDPRTSREMEAVYSTRKERLAAFVIDVVLVNVIFLIFSIFVNFGDVLWISLYVLSFPLYKMLTEGFFSKTVGKLFLDLKVVQYEKDFAAINLWTALKRFLLRWPFYLALLAHTYFPEGEVSDKVNIMVALGLIAGILAFLIVNGSIFMDNNNRTWCDKLAGTVCIHQTRKQKLSTLEN